MLNIIQVVTVFRAGCLCEICLFNYTGKRSYSHINVYRLPRLGVLSAPKVKVLLRVTGLRPDMESAGRGRAVSLVFETILRLARMSTLSFVPDVRKKVPVMPLLLLLLRFSDKPSLVWLRRKLFLLAVAPYLASRLRNLASSKTVLTLSISFRFADIPPKIMAGIAKDTTGMANTTSGSAKKGAVIIMSIRSSGRPCTATKRTFS